MDNKSLIFVGIFFALCLAVAVGVWYGLHELSEYRDEYDTMISERDNFSAVMEDLRAKNKILNNVNKLNFDNVTTASDSVEFYSQVYAILDKYNMNTLSMSSNENDNSGSVLTLKLSGNYYALIKVFADWRNMPIASRITSLKIVRDNDNPEELVDVDVVIEAWRTK